MRDLNKLSCSEAGKLGAIASAKTIAALKQKRIDDYNNSPKLCSFCKSPLHYDKKWNNYCNHSCAAKQTAIIKGQSSTPKLENCLFCLSPIIKKGQSKYCSTNCMTSYWWQESKNNLLNSDSDTSFNHRVSKKYLIELNSNKCQLCNLSEWMNKPMPLVLDHINGNSEDGSLSNLRVICNNCDALTDTYKGKNRGKGRSKRRKRYHDGKSY